MDCGSKGGSEVITLLGGKWKLVMLVTRSCIGGDGEEDFFVDGSCAALNLSTVGLGLGWTGLDETI